MIPYAREAGAVVLLVALTAWSWLAYDYGHGNGLAESSDQVAAANKRAETVIAEYAKAEADALARARAAEQKDAREKHAAGEAYERGKADAQAASDAVVSDLRAGNVRLRDHWQGCVATDRLSRAAADAGQPDADAELRFADAGTAVRLADQCDAWIRSLQRVAP